ncbi:2-oxoglutarate synthase [Candidatus Parcubacteria bacterium]|nr:MAG: 2-oxoglutarate synthase [Candidatus Parcubacteria bacterium]
MSKDSKFCPGCGQTMILQTLYRILQEQKSEEKAVLGLDIGCSLLAWDFLPINTFQTHHGRVTATMVGFNRARPDLLSFAYTGDGGAYAIGLQSLLWAAKRNDPVTVIVANNAVYAMTGGQTAPTTMKDQKTDTSPSGYDADPVDGMKLIRSVNEKAYLARGAVNEMKDMKMYLEKAIQAQRDGNFAMVEILSFCPTNWRVKGKEMIEYVDNMKTAFPTGEF